MKYCICTSLLTALSFLLVISCRGQQKNVYNKFLSEYRTTNQTAASKASVLRHDTMVHPLAIASTYFVQEKVYPNEDAVKLIQQLNPKVDMSDGAKAVNGDTRLVLPNYPQVRPEVLSRFNADYSIAASPDPVLIQNFKNSSDIFNRIFQQLPVPDDDAGKKYYDSLAFFNNSILPYVNNSAQSISRLQMRYFYTELTALNRTLGKKKSSPVAYGKKPTVSHETASYIIEDFYEIASPVQIHKKSLYTQKLTKSLSSIDKKDFKMIFFDNLNATPFACNLYIYGKDDSGNRKQDPEMDSYDVWVGDKMSFSTSVKDSDPESYGFTKMGNPASTLPFNIGLGKWIVVMKKKSPDGVYLYKEISIFSETETEPDNPNARKVCYILE